MAKLIKFSSWYNLTKRLLVSPLVLLIIIIVSALQSIKAWVMFLRFGGEHMIYNKEDAATLDKIYQELKRKEIPNG